MISLGLAEAARARLDPCHQCYMKEGAARALGVQGVA
jgi:hypothetical protein